MLDKFFYILLLILQLPTLNHNQIQHNDQNILSHKSAFTITQPSQKKMKLDSSQNVSHEAIPQSGLFLRPRIFSPLILSHNQQPLYQQQQHDQLLALRSRVQHPSVILRNENICDICGLSSFYHNLILLHKDSHKIDSTFMCYLCSSSFLTEEQIIKHIISHDVKPFRCRYCTYKSNFKIDLVDHFSNT